MAELDECIGREWHSDFQEFIHDAREKGSGIEDEFVAQQKIYTKYANSYDRLMYSNVEQYNGFNILADAISKKESNKSMRILDFGCGTGLLGQALSERGFSNLDASDCNPDLLKEAGSKRIFKNLYHSRGMDDIPEDKVYDIVCSSGTFFLSSSHPSTDIFLDLIKLIKKGGSLIILTKKAYLEKDYVNWNIVNDLKEQKIIEEVEISHVPGYRKVFDFEEDRLSMASILHYRALR